MIQDIILSVRDFLELGGPVLNIIAIVIFVMWMLILERLAYFRTGLKSLKSSIQATWADREQKRSWESDAIREKLISQFSMSATRMFALSFLTAVGLMGTVTGMIEVFDVMAISGSGNARSMASGVSKATIPTMAGMVGALSGVFLVTVLNQKVSREVEDLEDNLTTGD